MDIERKQYMETWVGWTHKSRPKAQHLHHRFPSSSNKQEQINMGTVGVEELLGAQKNRYISATSGPRFSSREDLYIKYGNEFWLH